jgi:Ca-activated chloride channel family protein
VAPVFPIFSLSALLWAVSTFAFAQPQAASAELTLRSDVSEVRVTFSTTDQNNRVIATLQPNDFAIVDQDLVVRDFRSFNHSEYARLDVAVLVDASGSATPGFRQEISAILQLLVGSDNVPDEDFSVISFRDLKPAVICQGNCRALNAAAHFPSIATGGQTPLYDSIIFASTMLAHHSDLHARKLLILFSDGADTISLHSFGDAVNAAVENDVAIYSVDISKAPHVSPGTLVLRGLSSDTGGRYFPGETGTAKVLDAVLEDFHATYTVAYKLPSHATGFHPVRILPTRNLGLQFHCRRGYYYPTNPEN